jgi:FkbM family methyltransferase
MISYSQFQEDRFIAENLHLPDCGVFCEVGAFDGIACSNTLAFEQKGWIGMLVEPDPFNAAKCNENRVAPCWCCAVGNPGLYTFNVNLQDRGQSGLRRPGRIMPVIVARLDELLAACGFKHLHFLSIDTEGTELDVWGTIGSYRPWVVMIEFWSQPNPPDPDPVVWQMRKDGYREVHRTTANLIFQKE